MRLGFWRGVRMSNSASKWLTQLDMLTPGKEPWHSVFKSELVSSRITHTYALVLIVLHFDRTQHWHRPGRCSERELCSRTRMRRWNGITVAHSPQCSDDRIIFQREACDISESRARSKHPVRNDYTPGGDFAGLMSTCTATGDGTFRASATNANCLETWGENL